MCTRIHTHDFHWIANKVPSGIVPGGSKRALVQIRHRMEPIPAVINHDWNGMGLTIDFAQPVHGVAPGQVCAIYYMKWCLGSGVIKQTWTAHTHPIQSFRTRKAEAGLLGPEEAERMVYSEAGAGPSSAIGRERGEGEEVGEGQTVGEAAMDRGDVKQRKGQSGQRDDFTSGSSRTAVIDQVVAVPEDVFVEQSETALPKVEGTRPTPAQFPPKVSTRPTSKSRRVSTREERLSEQEMVEAKKGELFKPRPLGKSAAAPDVGRPGVGPQYPQVAEEGKAQRGESAKEEGQGHTGTQGMQGESGKQETETERKVSDSQAIFDLIRSPSFWSSAVANAPNPSSRLVDDHAPGTFAEGLEEREDTLDQVVASGPEVATPGLATSTGSDIPPANKPTWQDGSLHRGRESLFTPPGPAERAILGKRVLGATPPPEPIVQGGFGLRHSPSGTYVAERTDFESSPRDSPLLEDQSSSRRRVRGTSSLRRNVR